MLYMFVIIRVLHLSLIKLFVSTFQIPLQGHIKVKITQVLHATHYWCQLIKHVDNERNKTDLNCQYLNLQKKLDDYFK